MQISPIIESSLALSFAKMKRLPLFSLCGEASNNQLNGTLKNQLTVLKNGGCKILNKEDKKKPITYYIATRSKYKLVSPTFLVAVFGIICFAQNLTSADPCAVRLKDIVKQQKDVDNLESVRLKIATLSRVINAIVLQNAFQTKSMTINKSMVFDVQALNSFQTIKQPYVENFINTVKKIDFVTTKSVDTINITTSELNILEFCNTSEISIIPDLFSFNASSFHFGEALQNIYEFSLNFNLFIKNLKSPLLTQSSLIDERSTLADFFSIHKRDITDSPLFKNIKTIVHSLESAKSFVLNIEQYQLLTDQKFLRSLAKSVDSLEPFATIIDSLSNCEQNKRTKEQLDAIENFFNKTVRHYGNHAFIEFPQELKPIENLSEHFDNEWLKKLFNNGNSLADLKNLLRPLINYKTRMRGMENVINTLARNSFLKLVRQRLKQLNHICETKPKLFSSSLANVKATLENVMPIAGLNHSVLNEFKQFLISATFITSFSNELDIAVNIAGALYANTYEEDFWRKFVNNSEKISMIKREFLSNYYEPGIHLLMTKTRFFENQRNKVIDLFSKTTGFAETLTDAVLTNISKILSQNIKPDIENIRNHVQFLNSFLPLTKIEHAKINQLPEILSDAKNKIDKWAKLEIKLKKEIEETKGSHRLLNFPFAYETAVQLEFSQRAWVLIQRHNLCRIAQSFLTNGFWLSKKINNSTFEEGHLIDSLRKNFSSFEKSLVVFLTEIESLTTKFTIDDHSLKSFGESISVLDQINFSTFNVPLMKSTLNQLKTLLNESIAVSDVEKNLELLEGLQYTTMGRKKLLSMLLAQSDLFFQRFFYKKEKMETGWIHLLLVVTTFAMVLSFVFFSFCMWIKSTRAKKLDHQDEAQ